MVATYDLVIVGAGPAGSTAAWFAAQDPHWRILILDAARFPRDKTCGDAITRTKAMTVLHVMGLAEEFDQLAVAACSEGLVVGSRGARLSLPTPEGCDPLRRANRVCPRRVFDAWLLSKAKSRVEVREGVRVQHLQHQDGQWQLCTVDMATRRQEFLRARMVIGADGAHSIVAKHAGLHDERLPLAGVALRGYFRDIEVAPNLMEIYYLAPLPPGYLWIFPCGPGVVNVGLGIFSHAYRKTPGGLATLFWSLIRQHPVLTKRFQSARLVGRLDGWPLPIWRRSRSLSADGVLLVGDAAGLIDPLTGEGIGNALLSGQIAGGVAREACGQGHVSAAALGAYDRQLWHHIGGEMRFASLAQHLLTRSWFIDGLITLAMRYPSVRRLLVNAVTTPDGKRALLTRNGLLHLFRTRPLN